MSAVAVGVFDGLHLGHQRILARALERARARGGRTIVVTFDPHPDVVLGTAFAPLPPLTPHAERRARLAAMGIEDEVLPFTRELAALEPEEFVDTYLLRPFGMRDLVVGAGFALGRKRSGDVPRLRTIGASGGFEVEAVPLLERDGAPVSSTRIRRLLVEGNVTEAARLLGRRYGITGVVAAGDGVGATLGFPTANLRLHEEKAVPADGVYAVWARAAGDAAWRPAAMSIGTKPTFGAHPRALEVHVLDAAEDFGGREMAVEFEAWLRPQQAFPTIAALTDAIATDVRAVRERLAATPAPAA